MEAFNDFLMKHKTWLVALAVTAAFAVETEFQMYAWIYVACFLYFWGWFVLLERYQHVFFLECLLIVGGTLLPVFVALRLVLGS